MISCVLRAKSRAPSRSLPKVEIGMLAVVMRCYAAMGTGLTCVAQKFCSGVSSFGVYVPDQESTGLVYVKEIGPGWEFISEPLGGDCMDAFQACLMIQDYRTAASIAIDALPDVARLA